MAPSTNYCCLSGKGKDTANWSGPYCIWTKSGDPRRDSNGPTIGISGPITIWTTSGGPWRDSYGPTIAIIYITTNINTTTLYSATYINTKTLPGS